MIEPHRLLIGVVAHASRESMACELVDRVKAQVLNVDSTRAGSYDEAVTACAANHLLVLRKLQAQAIGSRWCIVLEDDALPIEDFRAHAARALRRARSPLVGFYISRAGAALNEEPLREALSTGHAWAVSNHLISAVAYAIHTDVLSDVIAHYAMAAPEATVEWRITRWAIMHRSKAFDEPRFYYTLPSLVDHSPGESIIFDDADSSIRRAWRLGAARDWDTCAVEYDPIIEGEQ